MFVRLIGRWATAHFLSIHHQCYLLYYMNHKATSLLRNLESYGNIYSVANCNCIKLPNIAKSNQKNFSHLKILIWVFLWKGLLKYEIFFFNWQHWIWNTIRILAFGVSHENLLQLLVQIWSFQSGTFALPKIMLFVMTQSKMKYSMSRCHLQYKSQKLSNKIIRLNCRMRNFES